MTPTSIKTGRMLSYTQKTVSLTQGENSELLPADGNRVGVALALIWESGIASIDYAVNVGTDVNGAFVALTSLNTSHPACWLDVAHLGPALLAPLRVRSFGSEAVKISVTQLRQIQELE